jgi:hypothetical protein
MIESIKRIIKTLFAAFQRRFEAIRIGRRRFETIRRIGEDIN